MTDDRTVQSVLTEGSLCTISHYRRANSICSKAHCLQEYEKHHLRGKTPEGGAESGFKNCTTFPARGRVLENCSR